MAISNEEQLILEQYGNAIMGLETTPYFTKPEAEDMYAGAVRAGFEGSMTDWLQSLQGQDGKDGENGADGTNGIDGASAYELYRAEGGGLNQAEWLKSLTGKSAYAVYKDNGGNLTEAAWLESLKGDSAYQLYKQQFLANNPGGTAKTQSEWLLSLKGEKGLDGESAYDTYLKLAQKDESEFSDEEKLAWDWLTNLKGLDTYQEYVLQYKADYGEDAQPLSRGEWLLSLRGKSAYDIAVETGVYTPREDNWADNARAWTQDLYGKSAYELYQIAYKAAHNGSTEGMKTILEWLASLAPELQFEPNAENRCIDIYQLADYFPETNGVRRRYMGKIPTDLKGDKGDKGDDAYEVYRQNAINAGVQNPMEKAEWLDYLKPKVNVTAQTANGEIVKYEFLVDGKPIPVQGGDDGLIITRGPQGVAGERGKQIVLTASKSGTETIIKQGYEGEAATELTRIKDGATGKVGATFKIDGSKLYITVT